jgi:hypothetical protein
MNIPNMYVICPGPAADDAVWSSIVSRDGLTYSLDGKMVILKWPGAEIPPEAECKRLGGTCYNYVEVLAVLAGADWTAPQVDEESPVAP